MKQLFRRLMGLPAQDAVQREPVLAAPLTVAPPTPRAVLRPAIAAQPPKVGSQSRGSETQRQVDVVRRDDQLQVASPENHARLFLEYLWAEHPRGGLFKAKDVAVLYGEFALMRQMQPVSWNSVARRIRSLTGHPKAYITENRRRICCYRIPARSGRGAVVAQSAPTPDTTTAQARQSSAVAA